MNRIIPGSYTTASLRRGDRYRATEFDEKIDAVVFIPPDRSRIITDTEHVILDIIHAPDEIELQPCNVSQAAFVTAVSVIMASVWLSVLIAFLIGGR